jgi:hypothetical protein
MPSFGERLSPEQIDAVAAFVSTSAKGASDGKPVVGEFEADDTELADCKPNDWPCYEQAFGNVAFEDSPKAAIALLEQRMRTDASVAGNCHRIAHAMGAAMLARYKGSVAQAFVNGTAVCWSGVYHGILERAFVGVSFDELGAVGRKLCDDADIRRTSFIAYQCVHGLGHGLMIYTGYDLPLALKTCDQQATAWDQTSCTSGVFMENLSSSYGVKSRWLKDANPIYPCDAVAQRHKLYCYLMVTSRILPLVNWDWRKAAEWCRRSDRGWVGTCFQSLGRDASGSSNRDPRTILEHCAVAGNMEGDCIYGAARDIVSNDAGAAAASRFCALAPGGYRPRCFEGIGTILGNLYPSGEDRRKACAGVTRTFYAACVRGARA